MTREWKPPQTHQYRRLKWSWSWQDRPRWTSLADAEEDGQHYAWLAAHWGHPGSDPLVVVELDLAGGRIGRWFSRAYWRHQDRRHATEQRPTEAA